MNKMTIDQILEKYPFAMSYFVENKLDIDNHRDKTFQEFLDGFTHEQVEDLALDKKELMENLEIFISQMKDFLGINQANRKASMNLQ